MDINRKNIKVVHERQENDIEYLARTAEEMARGLEHVYMSVRCQSFNDDECGCETCKMYAKDNVERMAKMGLKGEKCSIRLTVNFLYGLRNRTTTGKD